AARALHRSQSRVSTHVAALERALGGLLIDRTHRPIGPTELGTTFLPHARAVLEALERGVEAVDQHTGTLRGRVVIGCHPSVSAGVLPGVIASVHARHPQVRVELTEHTTPDLVSGIVSGRFNIAIHSLAADPPSEDLQSVALWTERYVVVVPADHELARAWDAHAHPGPGDASDPTDPTDPAPSGAAPSLRGGPAGGGLDPAAVARHPLIAVARPGAEVDPDTGSALRAWGLGPGDPGGLADGAAADGGEPGPGRPRGGSAELAGRPDQRHRRDGSGPGGDPCRGPQGGGDPGPAHDRLAERGLGLRRHRVHISPGRRAPASSAHGRVAIELLRRSWAPAPIPLDAPDHLDARGRTVDPIGDGGSEASRRHWIRPAPLRPVRAAPRCGGP